MRIGWRILTAALAFGAEAVAQQAPPSPPTEPSRRLTFDSATTASVPATTPRDRTFDWTSGLDVTATCPTCPDDGRPPSTNGNAPWVWGARVRAGSASNWFGVGVVGQRNAQLPLFMAQPLGGLPQAEAPSSMARLGDTRTNWQVVLQGERTLWRSAHGVTTGVVGEVFLPLGAWGATPASADAPSPSSRALRGAFRVRF
jgi:hypothetical protein